MWDRMLMSRWSPAVVIAFIALATVIAILVTRPGN